VSSPIHHDTLVYAPRRAREQTQQVSTLPAAPQIELPARSFSGNRGMLERQHAPMGGIALLICSVVGGAVAVAVATGVWAKSTLPRGRCRNLRARKNQRVRPIGANRCPLTPQPPR
jgi:hypothetical protein